MEWKSLIEFNKYTVWLAAVGFAYTLEKFVPMPNAEQRGFVVLILCAFLLSLIFGILIFATATTVQSVDEAGKENAEKLMPWIGIPHLVLLGIAMLAVGVLLIQRVLADPPTPAPVACCCASATACVSPAGAAGK
jgi:hypothetical protein